MAKLAQEGVISAMNNFDKYDQHTVDVINENEDSIDRLADAVDSYLIGLSTHVPDGKNSEILNYYMQCFGEFERIGDHAVNLTENAAELHSRNAEFTLQARKELHVLSEALSDILASTYGAFSRLDFEAAKKIEPVEEVVDDMVTTLKDNHIKRLREGTCTMQSGLTFLDVLTNVERISDQCSNVGVYTVSLADARAVKAHDYISVLHQGLDEFFNKAYEERHEYYFGKLNK